MSAAEIIDRGQVTHRVPRGKCLSVTLPTGEEATIRGTRTGFRLERVKPGFFKDGVSRTRYKRGDGVQLKDGLIARATGKRKP